MYPFSHPSTLGYILHFPTFPPYLLWYSPYIPVLFRAYSDNSELISPNLLEGLVKIFGIEYAPAEQVHILTSLSVLPQPPLSPPSSSSAEAKDGPLPHIHNSMQGQGKAQGDEVAKEKEGSSSNTDPTAEQKQAASGQDKESTAQRKPVKQVLLHALDLDEDGRVSEKDFVRWGTDMLKARDKAKTEVMSSEGSGLSSSEPLHSLRTLVTSFRSYPSLSSTLTLDAITMLRLVTWVDGLSFNYHHETSQGMFSHLYLASIIILCHNSSMTTCALCTSSSSIVELD